MVTIPNGDAPANVAHQLRLAATRAGPRGALILSVGHGATIADINGETGFFDLGPKSSFRVGGRDAVMIGDTDDPKKHPVHTSAFYDFRVANPILKGGFAASRKDEDEKSGSKHAKQRLANWRHYESVGLAFRSLSVVVLLTCKVGNSSGFMRRVQSQWGCAILGYRRRIVGQPLADGRTRIHLEGDREGEGTNIPWGEYMFPVGADMVVFGGGKR